MQSKVIGLLRLYRTTALTSLLVQQADGTRPDPCSTQRRIRAASDSIPKSVKPKPGSVKGWVEPLRAMVVLQNATHLMGRLLHVSPAR